jgi:hypothetical protein
MYSKVIILEKTGNFATAALIKFAIDKIRTHYLAQKRLGCWLSLEGEDTWASIRSIQDIYVNRVCQS